MNRPQIDSKCLKGLKYHYSTSEIVEVEGKKQTVYSPAERDLTIDDVIATRHGPDGITFVVTDGRKYYWERKTGESTVV